MKSTHKTFTVAAFAAWATLVQLALDDKAHAATTSQSDDRTEIVDRLTDIAVGADRRDWARAQAAFAPHVRVDYSSLFGGQAATTTSADLVNGWKGVLPGFDATQHLVSNQAVQVAGDRATAQADFIATHRIEKDLWTLGGRYDYTLAKQQGRWRVTGMTMTWSWETGDRAVLLKRAVDRAATTAR